MRGYCPRVCGEKRFPPHSFFKELGVKGDKILSVFVDESGMFKYSLGQRHRVFQNCPNLPRDFGDIEEKWAPVTEGDENGYRFFKVKVEMP